MYYEDQKTKAKMLSELNTATTQTLKGSIEISQLNKRVVNLESKINVMKGFICKFLDEFEGAWDNDEQCASPEIAQDYIDAAKWMANNFGRTENRIDDVQKWHDNYLPFKSK